jgi:hypothetical protein
MPAKRVLISVDDRLLPRIDRAAGRRGLTRSGYLAELASRDIGIGGGPGKDPTAVAALQALDEMFADTQAFDATTAVRAVRGTR